ncbi:MAG TPA: hypothetical protein VF855_02475 [Acidimicrobiales bacterium]
MSTQTALAAAATLVALAFALSTLERWLARRRPHDTAWTVSLLLFAGASAALWLGSAIGWDAPTFRAFYLMGAILNVPWLALGSVYLLFGRRAGDPAARALVALSFFAAGVLAVAPIRGSLPGEGLPQGSDVFGILPRTLAAVCSGVGATVVFALAMLSAVRLLRGRRHRTAAGAAHGPGRLALGNLLIAAGTVVLSLSGTLNARLGEMTAFASTLVAGIVLLFAGFLVASAPLAPVTLPVTAMPSELLPGGSAKDAAQELAAESLR